MLNIDFKACKAGKQASDTFDDKQERDKKIVKIFNPNFEKYCLLKRNACDEIENE